VQWGNPSQSVMAALEEGSVYFVPETVVSAAEARSAAVLMAVSAKVMAALTVSCTKVQTAMAASPAVDAASFVFSTACFQPEVSFFVRT
jgi:hypothetical protein